MTGSSAVRFPEVCAILAEVTGSALTCDEVPIADFEAFLRASEVPEEVVPVVVDLFTTTLDGRNSAVANGVFEVLGRAPRAFRDYAIALSQPQRATDTLLPIEPKTMRAQIRQCSPDDSPPLLQIINAAAEAYRGVIPDDRWHDPYMSSEALDAELADGVAFFGRLVDDAIVGIMGVQRRHNVDLIRHAYVLPGQQGRGIGSSLLRYLCHDQARPILFGT